MKNSTDLGIHVFEKNNKLDWEMEILIVNLLSALTWKNFHGPIKMFCNKEYYEILKKYGIDTLYDEINTELLDNKPNDIDYVQYWAFGKLWVIKHLKNESPFTLVDTDLWLLGKLQMNKNSDVQMYHLENYSPQYKNNIYVDYNPLIPAELREMDLDENCLPTNCAILTINNNSFVEEWIDLSEQIAKYNTTIPVPNNNTSSKMCLVEQRLLPMLLKKNGLSWSTYIDHIYQSQLADPQDGSEWFPRLENSTPEMVRKFASIKHVWGLKKYFNIDHIRNLVMRSCLQTLDLYPIKGEPYEEIVNQFRKTYDIESSQVLASDSL